MAGTSQAVQGLKIIHLFRLHEMASEVAGTRMAYVTESTRSISTDSDSVVTKDGTLQSGGTPEITLSTTSYLKKGDPMIQELEDAMLSSKLIDVWEANLEDPRDAAYPHVKFAGIYYQALITEFEETTSAEDLVEYAITFKCNGKGARGDVTVTAEQQEEAAYVFQDTTIQPDCTLSALTIADATLSPTFDRHIKEYTTTVDASTSVVTATARDDDATVVIKNGSTTVTSGSSATWEAGENILTVTVTNGAFAEVYKVTVRYITSA